MMIMNDMLIYGKRCSRPGQTKENRGISGSVQPEESEQYRGLLSLTNSIVLLLHTGEVPSSNVVPNAGYSE
jgi:hypothetical protein